MKFDYSKLSGKIREVCGSQSAFAGRMETSERTISLKLSGKRDWKQTEMNKACEVLNIPIREMPAYFFVPNVQS